MHATVQRVEAIWDFRREGLSMKEIGRRLGISRNRVWQILHPVQAAAHSAVANALRSGKLVRPAACAACDLPCRPQAHHADYYEPLRVEWLCRVCHSGEHSGTKRLHAQLLIEHLSVDDRDLISLLSAQLAISEQEVVHRAALEIMRREGLLP